MQFENFDKKVKEAADHHYPSYDEGAWARMEKLLDKNLPQKKDDRRRLILFLMLFLLLGGGITFLLLNNKSQYPKQLLSSEQDNISQGDSNKPGNSSIEKNKQILTTEILPGSNNKISDEKELIQAAIAEKLQPTHMQSRYQVNPGNKKSQPDKFLPGKLNESVNAIVNSNVVTNNTSKREESLLEEKAASSINTKQEIKNNSRLENSVAEKTINVQDQDREQLRLDSSSQNKIATEKDITSVKPLAKSKKVANKKRNAFFVYLSAAPDVSMAGNDKIGKLKLTTGLGLGYSFHDRFTLRAGFGTSRKIYSASPGEYHPPAAFWSYYPNLENVDADCKVYEIPVLLSYNFKNSSKQSWLVTAGLSSYLMKRETYNYTYKDPGGQYRNTSRTIYDQNKHYFSILTLSAGYQRKINNTFSVMAEPYLKIPMSGIGYGNVKLNSAGLMFSVGIKPFGSSK